MAELILTVFLDALMAILLIITVVYCGRLNKRIKILQDSKSELANIIQEFDISTQKATQSIAEIHEATSRIAENMQHKIDKANYLADDLQFMIEKGTKMAGQMDGAPVRPSRSARAEREEAEEARPMRGGKSSRAAIEEIAAGSDSAKERKRSSIESVIKRARANNADNDDTPAEAEPKRSRRQGARLRSKAEQELFEALKAGGSKG